MCCCIFFVFDDVFYAGRIVPPLGRGEGRRRRISPRVLTRSHAPVCVLVAARKQIPSLRPFAVGNHATFARTPTDP
jgi:hypothetical protein